MKNKVGAAFSCVLALLLCTMTGCQLALADKGAGAGEDRLVGVLVTKEHLDLFDMEGYLKDNISFGMNGEITVDGNSRKYQGRIYGNLVTETLTNEKGEAIQAFQYVFEGINGIPYIYAKVPDTEHGNCYITKADDAISDKHTNLKVSDLENVMELNATIFVSPNSGLSSFFVNPVYQSADGQVYVVTGQGISSGGDQPEGTVSSYTLTSSRSLSENGKTVKDSTSVKISVQIMYPPNKIVILQMDDASAAVSRQEYAPEAVPKAITPVRNAEYIVVEMHKTDYTGKEQVTRMAYGKDALSLDTFHCRTDGICVKQGTQLDWAK